MTPDQQIRRRIGAIHVAICIAVAITLLITGCSSGEGSAVAAGSSFGQGPLNLLPVDSNTMNRDIAAAIKDVDTFWKTNWTEYFRGEYRSPTIYGSYQGTTGPTCSGQPSSPDNAFYCRAGNFIAWDMDLMTSGYSKGPAFVYLVIAHEWGHEIQAQLPFGIYSSIPELQADCLAGAELAGAVAAGILQWGSGWDNEIAGALSFLGDQTTWTSPTEHGTALERAQWFMIGRQSGVPGCFPGTSLDAAPKA